MSEALIVRRGGKKSGKYVWKKYSPGITITNPTFTAVVTSSNITITNPSFDLSYITQNNYKEVLNGFQYSINENMHFALESGKLYWYSTASSKQEVTAYSNGVITVKVTANTGTYASMFKGDKTFVEQQFLDYVVSDDPTAYPDGGIQGGYWYEKVVEGIDLSALGWTKCAIDYITPSTDADLSVSLNNSPLRHSLGIAPKYIHIKSSSDFTPSSYNLYLLEFVGCYSKDSSFHGGKMYCANSSTTSEYTPIFSSDSKNIMIRDTYLMKGIQYQIITIG